MSASAPFPRPLCPLPARLAVLLSGRGSNFEALAEASDRGEFPGRIVLVVSDVPTAAGLEKARSRGIPSKVIGAGPRATRVEREAELAAALAESRVDLVCLAGFMRILSPEFLALWPLRILNVHPSLLPAFPGLHAQEQAVRYGARVSGATVHFVDVGTDTGPIVAQSAVPVLEHDDALSLAARTLPVEHALYVSSVRRVLEGGWRVSGRSVAFQEPAPI
ncbi:MAG: phosphoribosylglycinamide formyltransferase [Acidobacteriota bacterium]